MGFLCAGVERVGNAREGGKPNSGELSEGAGGTFGRLALVTTAPYQEPLECNHSKAHSKAHNFKEEWKERRGREGGGPWVD